MAKAAGSAGRTGSRDTLEGFRAQVLQVPGVERFELYEGKDSGYLQLDNVRVAVSRRGEGIGDRVMRMLTSYADRNGKTIELTPDAYEFGGGRGQKKATKRLEDWYKGYGFTVNRGPRRDFMTRAYMLRRPRG